MMNEKTKKLQLEIFRNASKTYYYSSLFFPKKFKDDVFTLYAWVRLADNFVDVIPQQKKEFLEFKKITFAKIDALESRTDSRKILMSTRKTNFDSPESNSVLSDETLAIILEFVKLYERKKFKREWITAFLDAMESDLKKVLIKNKTELENYMYGSAGVIGYMLCAIFEIKLTQKNAYVAAKNLGYSMQYINFIRDISEDTQLGRTYLYEFRESTTQKPNNAQVKTKSPKDVNQKEAQKISSLQRHLLEYKRYAKSAEKGYSFLPYRIRVCVLTAQSLYLWTAKKIAQNPKIVFERKVKPSHLKILMNFIQSLGLALWYSKKN
jgi:15-cis-phytoene synthase